MTQKDYLINPCRTSSLPLWKMKSLNLPTDILVIHKDNIESVDLNKYQVSKFFRLIHTSKDNSYNSLESKYNIEDGNVDQLTNHINECYDTIKLNRLDVEGFTKRNVYNKHLWIIIRDIQSHNIIGSGIAEIDHSIREGIIEWLQVSPSYRKQGIGTLIVNTLIERMRSDVDFITVSGDCDNPHSPESLYRECGFTGDDIWYILNEK